MQAVEHSFQFPEMDHFFTEEFSLFGLSLKHLSVPELLWNYSNSTTSSIFDEERNCYNVFEDELGTI